MNKICSKCKIEKEISEFYKDNTKKNGLRSECRECQKLAKRVYRINNKEKIAEAKRVYRINNKEKIAEARRVYRINNKEKIAEARRVYRINNKEKIAEARRVLRQTEHYKFKHNIENHKRRCKVRNLPHNLKQSEWKEILEFFNNSCANCGSKDNLHKDHFIPLASDNCTGTTKSNIIPLCENCNLEKSSKEPREFFSKEKYIFIKTFLLKQKGLWLG